MQSGHFVGPDARLFLYHGNLLGLDLGREHCASNHVDSGHQNADPCVDRPIEHQPTDVEDPEQDR